MMVSDTVAFYGLLALPNQSKPDIPTEVIGASSGKHQGQKTTVN